MSAENAHRIASGGSRKHVSWIGAAAAAALLVAAALSVWFFVHQSHRPAPTQTTAPSAISPASPAASLPIGTGSILLDTLPPGADVTLGGKPIGKSPLTLNQLRPGKYRLRVALDGYETLEREIEVGPNETVDLGAIALSRGQASVELTTTPSGASVYLNGTLLGTTPLHRSDLAPGDATFFLTADGYLPREIKGELTASKAFNKTVALAPMAHVYVGEIRVENDNIIAARPVSIAMNVDTKSGTMTQGSRHGDFAVKFNGVWEGTYLHAVTGEVVSQPSGIRWHPESFTLQFNEDGKSGVYECIADGKTYQANLSVAPSVSGELVRIAPAYGGTLENSHMPVTFNFNSDRKSGTMTQRSKSGDVVVKFAGIWKDKTLRAMTNDVVSKPSNVQWQPESFTLTFDESGRRSRYECVSDGVTYSADLTTP